MDGMDGRVNECMSGAPTEAVSHRRNKHHHPQRNNQAHYMYNGWLPVGVAEYIPRSARRTVGRQTTECSLRTFLPAMTVPRSFVRPNFTIMSTHGTRQATEPNVEWVTSGIVERKVSI